MTITYHQVDLHQIAAKLKSLLESNPRIKVAILFGSALRRSHVQDIDIAVYAQPPLKLSELIELSHQLEDTLQIPVDIVPLEKTPPKLRLKALTQGHTLVKKSSTLYTYLLHTAMSEAMDMEIKLKEAKGKYKSHQHQNQPNP